MATKIHQSAKLRAGGKVTIKSNYPSKKVSMRVPRGMKVRIKKS